MNLLNHSEATQEPLLPWVETASAALATTVNKWLLAPFPWGNPPRFLSLKPIPFSDDMIAQISSKKNL